jgi:uncharacterized membrane protein
MARTVFALGIAGIGVQDVVRRELAAGLQPVPAWLPARAALAVAIGAAIAAAAVAIALDLRGRSAARALAALLGLWVVAVHVPLLVGHLSRGSEWTVAFELLALASAAAVIGLPERPALGRLGYAISLPVFGVLHFVYRDYTASVIPGWIPGHMAWALITGVAHIAAGASLLVGWRVRLTAHLLAVMFGSWAVILHIPRVAERDGANEWTSLLVAVAMCGGAWLIAEAAARPPARGSAR